MTNKERTVEEIVEEFDQKYRVLAVPQATKQKKVDEALDNVHNWLTQTLTLAEERGAERKTKEVELKMETLIKHADRLIELARDLNDNTHKRLKEAKQSLTKQ